jgi:N-acetylglucosamine kinase-like BadF-type ATPase
MAQYFLGVDGGQSSTVALIGDENGVVMGYGATGPSNHVRGPGGLEKLRKAVTISAGAAWRNSPYGGKQLPTFESAFFGMTGGGEDKAPIIRELIRARVLEVSHDAVTALIGATEGQPGIIVIAGTGSICFGMNARGQTARAGGWGYVFGDEGGAFGLARAALVAALRYEEGWGPPTQLRHRIITFSEAKDLNDALHKWYSVDFPRDRVASFSRQVDEAARDGDRVAREILRSGASELAQLVGHVRRRIFKPRDLVLVSHIGGVWKSRIVRDRFRRLVEEQGESRVQAPVLGPAAGALLAAYRNAGRLKIKLRNLPPEL